MREYELLIMLYIVIQAVSGGGCDETSYGFCCLSARRMNNAVLFATQPKPGFV